MAASQTVTGEVTLSVDGAPLKMQLTVPARAVKPQVMVPIFHNMANAFAGMGIAAVEAKGEHISCKKGCGACCRQVIPLTEVEVYYTALLVDFLPEPRRTEIKRRFSAAVAQFRSIGWDQQFDACEDEDALKVAILEYFFQGIACPFLEDEACSIYEHRPVRCREFLVTSPSENCNKQVEETLRQVPLPVNASDGMSNLAWSGNLSAKKFLPLVFALDWVAQHPESFSEKTGPEWLAEFFGAGG